MCRDLPRSAEVCRGEVLLSHPYGCEIDTWSLGCIVGEFFLGLPLFPGESEYNQLCRIVEMLGARRRE